MLIVWQEYLQGVARKYNLYKHIRFNSTVEKARWDEAEKKWKISVRVSGDKDAEFAEGYTIASDFLVSAVGQLNMPQYPKIPGLDDFKGKKMHSARWDWSYGLEGKRIAVIGNGKHPMQQHSRSLLTPGQAHRLCRSSRKSQR